MEYKLINKTIRDSNILNQILLNRGFETVSEIQHYLNTTNDDILNPLLLDNMYEGAQMLMRHVSNNDKTLLWFDVDLDGYSSGAAFLNYFHYLFPTFIENSVSYQTNEGKKHGLILDNVPEGIKFIIMPDAGSNNIEECQVLKEQRNIDILILDHHECDNQNPYACVINNQMCDYPNKTLSGVGIVYKFCQYFDSLLGTDYANNIIDLVALGMIADVMDLRDFETKRIIDMGLAHIINPFFQTMVLKQEYSLKGEITPIGIAFYVVPFVNAVARIGKPQEKLLIFESLLDYKGNEMIPSTKRGCKGQEETRAEQACRTAANIKAHQQKERDRAVEIIEELIEEQDLLKNKILVVRLDEEHSINRALTGLVANILMGRYKRPVLLLSQTKDEEGHICWEGSGRNVGHSKFENFREFLRESGYVMYSEGHNNAFGAGIRDDLFDAFIEYSNEALKDYDFSACYQVDFIFDQNTLEPRDVLGIANLNHFWGTGIEEPYIAIENIKITDNVILMSPDKSPTMKILLPNGITAIKFKSSVEEVEQLKGKGGFTNQINVIGRCAANVWNGNTTAQILIEDYEIVKTYYDF